MESHIIAKLDALELKMNEIYISSEKTRKYFKWTLIITIVLFVLPLIGLAIAIPSFVSTYTQTLQGVGF